MTLSRRAGAVTASVALVAAGLAAAPADAVPRAACDNRTNGSIQKILECVTLEGVLEHQEALQQIADDNGGNRASGFPGYDASVDYVAERMESAGYDVRIQEFDFNRFEEEGPSALQ